MKSQKKSVKKEDVKYIERKCTIGWSSTVFLSTLIVFH